MYVLPADTQGCGHYRLIWPADILRKQGFDVTILPPSKESGILARTKDLPDGTEEIVSIQVPADADVIVVQRPAHPLQSQMIKVMRSNGIAVVVDMDDDMSAIHPDNIAFHAYRHKNPNSKLSWKYALDSCMAATMVTTSTAALQKVYARRGHGVVIDNYVPEAVLTEVPPASDGFGWAGATHSHPGDLQMVGQAARQLVDEGFPIRVVGGKSAVRVKLKLADEPEYTGNVSLDKWVNTIASTYTVGMVPLEASAFNRAKSRLKGIEHMAAGVPWIASPREEYRRLHAESGCGFLADTPKEWYTQLKRLLTDDVLRKEQIDMGRQYMKDQTFQAQAWRWAEAWTTALKLQRS